MSARRRRPSLQPLLPLGLVPAPSPGADLPWLPGEEERMIIIIRQVYKKVGATPEGALVCACGAIEGIYVEVHGPLTDKREGILDNGCHDGSRIWQAR